MLASKLNLLDCLEIEHTGTVNILISQDYMSVTARQIEPAFGC